MAKIENFVVGEKEVLRAAEERKIKKIIFASNCPEFIKAKFDRFDVEKEMFDGDEEDLGTYLGRAHPIAVVGVKNEDNA